MGSPGRRRSHRFAAGVTLSTFGVTFTPLGSPFSLPPSATRRRSRSGGPRVAEARRDRGTCPSPRACHPSLLTVLDRGHSSGRLAGAGCRSGLRDGPALARHIRGGASDSLSPARSVDDPRTAVRATSPAKEGARWRRASSSDCRDWHSFPIVPCRPACVGRGPAQPSCSLYSHRRAPDRRPARHGRIVWRRGTAESSTWGNG